MFQLLRTQFFGEQLYSLLYMHHFFSNMGRAAMYVFTGAYFLNLGMPLHFVLLFYGLEFGVRGLLCPFGLAFMQRVGFKPALVISTVLRILFFAGIALAGDNLVLAFLSLFIHAISGAIYYPFLDIMEAIYVKDDKHRTKQLSMSLVSGSLGMIVGSTAVGILLTHYGFNWVLFFNTIMLALSLVPFFILKEETSLGKKLTPNDVFQFLVHQDFKPLWAPFFGEQLTIIFKIIMVPLFISTVVSGFDQLGYLIALAIITEKVFTLLAGHYTDKFGVRRTLKFSVFSYSLAMLGYITAVKTPFSIFLLESYHKIVGNIYGAAFRSGIHAHARKTFPKQLMLMGAGYQMALCLGELLVLPIYALLSYFMGFHIFTVSCIMAAFGVWLAGRYFWQKV